MKRLTIIFALLVLLAACSEDFTQGPKIMDDPNMATNVGTEELLVAMQSNSYGVLTSFASFLVSMWMQQTSAQGCQWGAWFVHYDVEAEHFTGLWEGFYGSGGLLDIRKIQKTAQAEGKKIVLAIAKMWEALLMSTAADLWGDIPYAQAVQLDQCEEPVFDRQSAVHQTVLDLIDSAIRDFQTTKSDGETFDGSLDFTYGGDIDKWIAAAHTLKARILLNWGEVFPDYYELALAEARQGIPSDADNWKTRHSDTEGEESPYWQFITYRMSMTAGYSLVELLKAHNDPRLQLYFDKDWHGEYSGSCPFTHSSRGSPLNEKTFGAKDLNFDLVSWFENQFIIAECQYAAGDEADALTTLNEIIQPGIEAKWGLKDGSLPRYENLTGIDLLEAIMLEKYKAMFLNIQVWSDWRRTAFPKYEHLPRNHRFPRRFLYSEDELKYNSNTPRYEDPLYHRNENDPGNPDYSTMGLIGNL